MTRVQDESGQVLVLSLISLVILSLTTAAVLTGSAINHRTAANSANARKAFALAEQGLAYAEGRLYTAPSSAESVLVPGTTVTPSDGDGSITYSGTLCTSASSPPCDPKVWTLYGTGTVGGQSRTVSATVTIPSQSETETQTVTTSSSDFSIWKYVYIDGASGCTSFSGAITINVPFYTRGCMNISGNVKFTGSDLEVGGALNVSGASKVGSSSQPISKMNVGGACSPAPCDGTHSPIWVNVPGVGSTLTPALTKPTIDLADTYAAADPGPALNQGCPDGSNVPTNFFDNDHTLNDSDGNINLFPGGAYDCKVGNNEIKWDGSKNLFVNGKFYFDGNLSLSGNTSVVYSGEGTLYFTGTINQSGTTKLCGISGCTTQWDTTKNVLILVAGCQDSTGGTISGCVNLSGTTTMQAGIFSNNDYSISGSAVNMGPVIASNGTFSGSASQFVPLSSVPDTAPSDSTTTTQTETTTTTVDGNPSQPSNWNG